MSRWANIALLSTISVLLLMMLTIDYEYLSDKNSFLKSFVGTEMLGFFGVILTIAVGFLGQLYFSLDKLHSRLSRVETSALRKEIASTAWWLCVLYFSSLLLAFVKSFFAPESLGSAIINSLSLVVVAWFFLIFFDVVLSLFSFDT